MLRTMLRPAFQRVGAAAAARVSMHSAQRLTMQRLAVGGAVASVAFTLAQQAVAECKAPPADWHAVKSQLQALMADENAVNPSVDGADGSKGGGGYVAPLLLRLAWHSAGSYSKERGDGGTDGGTIRFEPEINHGGNAGLVHAIKLLEPIKASNPSVSWADLIVYAGVVAIEEMGGPTVGFLPGRTDAPKPNTPPAKDKRFTPDDRLPDGDKGAQHLRDIFYRMGFSDREIVCLSGAHAVGRCHTDRSGFWGPWKFGENAFSNEYFVNLLEMKWTPKKTHNGKPWTGPPQFESADGQLMMLPTDMALINDPKFKAVVEEYAKDEEKFFKDFAAVFRKLLENGCSTLGHA